MTTIFFKTTLGTTEIQHRSLGLSPLVRRLLVLVDGNRNAEELASFVPGHDVEPLLGELLEKSCIEAVGGTATDHVDLDVGADVDVDVPDMEAPDAAVLAALATLPPPGSRNAKQIDMARNFMVNTINTLLEQNTRLTLVKEIFDSKDAAELRQHYGAWHSAIASSWMGRKRLPELIKKLLAVL